MSRLSEKLQNRLRLRVNQYLNETCEIQRVDEVQGRLGMIESVVQVATSVNCRVIDDNRTAGIGYQQTGEHQARVDGYRLILPAGQTVDVAYRVVVGTRVYRVIELLDDRSNEFFIECRVRRVNGND